eukprot:SAG31_NODE_6504_length_1993_cov_1.328405_2_plen_335_part_00
MRVATYNVHMLTGPPSSNGRPDAWEGQQAASSFSLESPACVAHFAAAFAQLGADVIGLQEGVPHAYMQPIADELGMHLATFPSPLGRYRGVSGTLYPWGAPGHILSRWPILESRVWSHREPGTAAGAGGSGGPVNSPIWDELRTRLTTKLGRKPTDAEVTELSLDEASALFTRTAGVALLQLPNEVLVWVVNVHLHPNQPRLRQQEGHELVRRMEQLQAESPHIILMGDMNSGVDEAVHSELRASDHLCLRNSMLVAGREVQGTSNPIGPDPGPAIDHIYISSSLHAAVRGAEVICASGFHESDVHAVTRGEVWVHSDHLPVVCDLELGKGARL